jgi:hypothetical protein
MSAAVQPRWFAARVVRLLGLAQAPRVQEGGLDVMLEVVGPVEVADAISREAGVLGGVLTVRVTDEGVQVAVTVPAGTVVRCW